VREPDSGQVHTVDPAMSVDGSEKGVPPGASTEATVNARQLTIPPGQQQVAAGGNGKDADGQAHTNQAMIQGDALRLMTLQDHPGGLQQGEDLAKFVQDQTDQDRKAVDGEFSFKPAATVAWSALNDRGTMLETGLAEHLIRALTNKFDELLPADKAGPGENITASQITADGPRLVKVDGSLPGQQFEPLLSRAQNVTPDGQGNMGRIVHIIRNNIGQRHSQLTVQLEPPELGRLKIDVRLTDNLLRLNIVTETGHARQLIAERVEVLRTALEAQGITVSRFEVHTRESQHQQQQQNQWPNQPGYSTPQHNADQQGRHPAGQGEYRKFSAFALNQEAAVPPGVSRMITATQSTLNLVA